MVLFDGEKLVKPDLAGRFRTCFDVFTAAEHCDRPLWLDGGV